MTTKKPAISILFLILSVLPIRGQQNQYVPVEAEELHGPDSSIYRQILVNGRHWKSLLYNVNGNEFLFTNDWMNAEIIMNAHHFTGVTLKLDILNDELLFPSEYTNTIVVLNKEQVDAFILTFQGTSFPFVKLTTGNGPVEGYVQVLYDGKVKLYQKWKKRIQVNQDRLIQEFRTEATVYLRKGAEYHKIKRKGDLLKAFEEHQKELKKWIRDERLQMNLSNVVTLIPLLEKIDSDYM